MQRYNLCNQGTYSVLGKNQPNKTGDRCAAFPSIQAAGVLVAQDQKCFQSSRKLSLPSSSKLPAFLNILLPFDLSSIFYHLPYIVFKKHYIPVSFTLVLSICCCFSAYTTYSHLYTFRPKKNSLKFLMWTPKASSSCSHPAGPPGPPGPPEVQCY